MNGSNKLSFISLFLIVLITACGGGGGGSTVEPPVEPPPPPPPPVGKFVASSECVGSVSGAQCVEHVETSIHFWLEIPNGLPKVAPTLLLLHDAGSSGAEIASYIGASTIVDAQKYIGIYPDLSDFSSSFTFDISKLGLMLAELPLDYPVDINQIMVSGYAEGGAKAYALACNDENNRVAGIISIGGNFNLSTGALDNDCPASNPKSLLHIHGEIDDVAPVTSNLSANGFAGVYDISTLWASQSSCTGDTANQVDSFELTTADDFADIENSGRSGVANLFSYLDCSLPISYAIIDNGTHYPAFNPMALESLISDFISNAASKAIPDYQGDWLTNETINPGSCGGQTINDSHQISISQQGSSLQVITNSVLTTNGPIDVVSDGEVDRDGSMIYHDEFNDALGVTRATVEVVMVDENNLSATTDYTWTGTNSSCSGSSVYTATRL